MDECFIVNNRKMLSKFLIKSWLETFLSSNPHEYSINIDYSDFLYNKFRNIPLALKNLAIIEKRFLYPIDRFRVYRLKH